MTALADSLDAFTRWTKTIEARLEALGEAIEGRGGIFNRIEALEASLSCPPPSSPLLQRILELEGTVRRLSEQVFDSPEAKPGPSFTARAGETITIECVIPNCEVCESAAGKPPLSPTDEKR